MPLTDTACKNARCPEGRPYTRLADSGGLYLEVTSTGSKLWRWKYRFLGKEKRLALGVYASTSVKPGSAVSVSLAEARKRHDSAREQLAGGVDPGAARQEAKRAALTASDTAFEPIARRWWADWKVNKSERHADYVMARLKSDAFPEIGRTPVAQITAPALVQMAKKIEGRGVSELAYRLLATCNQIMRWAVAHGLAERNPAADVKPGEVLKPKNVENHARIGAAELPELMRKIATYEGSVYTRLALQLIALTFVRTSELIEARWGEFNLEAEEWRIPAERMKMRRPLIVPLSRQAIEVLNLLQTARGEHRCRPETFLFPGERDHDRPMSNNTILYALYRMGYRGRMTGHGFRGVASTALNEMGYRPDVIEAQLAHVEGNRVRAAYNHAQYLDERRELMQAWADYLDAVRISGKVIPFRQVRARAAA